MNHLGLDSRMFRLKGCKMADPHGFVEARNILVADLSLH
jgi:hypothetical protein